MKKTGVMKPVFLSTKKDQVQTFPAASFLKSKMSLTRLIRRAPLSCIVDTISLQG